MSTNERDTHFANFAKLLWGELVRANEQDDMFGFIDVNAGDIDGEEQQRYQAIIARRAFDLAEHVIHMHTAIERRGTIMTPGEVICKMPDLNGESLPPLDFPEHP